ncbi:MAG: phage tail protein, partial [Firmicutes bacterium]|nr:phage tail protein [Bacillota bacterium]
AAGAAATAVGASALVGSVAWGAAAITSFTLTTAVNFGIMYGASKAIGAITGKRSNFSNARSGYSSPTYSFGPLQTQTSNLLPIPIVYGIVKMAGNMIYQRRDGSEVSHRLVAFADGEIEGLTDVKLNDLDISTLPGCSWSGYNGLASQDVDSRVTGVTQSDKAKTVGGLNNLAYIGVTARASEKLNGSYNITTIVHGSIVRVYTNPTTYFTAFTDNPAWCILDFLTRYNGCGLSHDDINISSFIEAAEYCDGIVDSQKRFTLNIVLDERKSNIEWLDDLMMCCRGYWYYQNGKVSIKIEKQEISLQSFDEDNILIGSEKFWTLPREKKFDVCKVQYIDPNNQYARIYAIAEAETINNDPPIINEVEIFGVTNFNQASRLAWFYLNQAQLCDKYISFMTHKGGLDRTVGDIIEITSTFLGYSSKKMRIISLIERAEGQIEITCKEYNSSLYGDMLGSAEPVVNTVTLEDPNLTPDDVT